MRPIRGAHISRAPMSGRNMVLRFKQEEEMKGLNMVGQEVEESKKEMTPQQ